MTAALIHVRTEQNVKALEMTINAIVQMGSMERIVVRIIYYRILSVNISDDSHLQIAIILASLIHVFKYFKMTSVV